MLSNTADAGKPPRTRDPARKQRLLTAAAQLIAANGYHTVSMADLGAAAGITASAVYRHFESKSAVLVALLDSVIDALLNDAEQTVRETENSQLSLQHLVAGQVGFVIEQRELAQVYQHEVHSLAEEDQRRLRRKQRSYLEQWVALLIDRDPGLDSELARARVHAAIGAIQSTLQHRSGLKEQQLRRLLEQAGMAVLGER